MFASHAGDEALVRLFLARGARPELRTLDGYTALHYAAGSGDAGVAALLCAAPGAAAAIDLPGGENGETALAMACAEGFEAVVSVLLASGASLAPRDEEGGTALSAAVMGGHAAVVALLCAAPGAAAALATRCYDDLSPLEIARSLGFADCEAEIRLAMRRLAAVARAAPAPAQKARRRSRRGAE
jgi:ankyrin repeat protein